ncbi:MAG TPA: PqqD family protein [Phycisphaerae bacterium]|nr:PqqD family protein [Phycisphaerae bacterium]HRW55467.1 PqqD family protein [Phycisphaerae bacterium]
MTNRTHRPLARREGLQVFPLDDEAIVYDLARDTVHYLNFTARSVWEYCDGVRSPADIARILAAELADPDAAFGEDLRRDIESAVEALQNDGLLRPCA